MSTYMGVVGLYQLFAVRNAIVLHVIYYGRPAQLMRTLPIFLSCGFFLLLFLA